jgi:hypothetical protein
MSSSVSLDTAASTFRAGTVFVSLIQDTVIYFCIVFFIFNCIIQQCYAFKTVHLYTDMCVCIYTHTHISVYKCTVMKAHTHTHTHTHMYMTLDLFHNSRSLVVPSVDHLNMNKTELFYTKRLF